MNDVTTLLPPEARAAYRQDAIRRMWGASKPLPLEESLLRLASTRPTSGPPVIPGKKDDVGGRR